MGPGLPSKQHAAALRARGKHAGVIICALAHRADRIAFALVRDQEPYDPARWTVPASTNDRGPTRDQE